MNNVTYEGKEYIIREVYLNSIDESVVVAGDSLGSALVNDDGDLKDEVARGIDDYIYCYVDENILIGTQEELNEYVDKNFT